MVTQKKSFSSLVRDAIQYVHKFSFAVGRTFVAAGQKNPPAIAVPYMVYTDLSGKRKCRFIGKDKLKAACSWALSERGRQGYRVLGVEEQEDGTIRIKTLSPEKRIRGFVSTFKELMRYLVQWNNFRYQEDNGSIFPKPVIVPAPQLYKGYTYRLLPDKGKWHADYFCPDAKEWKYVPCSLRPSAGESRCVAKKCIKDLISSKAKALAKKEKAATPSKPRKQKTGTKKVKVTATSLKSAKVVIEPALFAT